MAGHLHAHFVSNAWGRSSQLPESLPSTVPQSYPRRNSAAALFLLQALPQSKTQCTWRTLASTTHLCRWLGPSSLRRCTCRAVPLLPTSNAGYEACRQPQSSVQMQGHLCPVVCTVFGTRTKGRLLQTVVEACCLMRF